MPNLDSLFFFDGRPAALALYIPLEAWLLTLPDVRCRVQKSQISFSNKHVFACVSFLRADKSRPRDSLTLSFGLNRRLNSPRIAAAVEPYPGRWTHHLPLSRKEELDDELFAWLKEAAEFSAVK